MQISLLYIKIMGILNFNPMKVQFVLYVLKGGLGFKKVVVFGCDYDYSRTTMKHLLTFLKDNYINLKSSAEIRKAIEKGYLIDNTDVAVWYDETMK